MAINRINNKLVYGAGDEEDFETLIFMDSQAKEACKRPGSFGVPPKSVVKAIPGGGVRDVLAFRNEAVFQRAKFIVLAGIGANDLAAYAPVAELAPPRVIEVRGEWGEAGRELVRGAKPSAVHQRPRSSSSGSGRARYEDILAAYEELYAALGADQILVTMTPIARKSAGFVNFQLSLLESRIRRIGFHHHHVNTLKAFAAPVKKRHPMFGGRRQTKDTKFANDDVHLTGDCVRLFFESIVKVVDAVKPDVRAEQSGKIVLSPAMFFKFAF